MGVARFIPAAGLLKQTVPNQRVVLFVLTLSDLSYHGVNSH